jgi:two-component sensor histidine kinase
MLFGQGIASNDNYIITKRMLSMEDGLPSRMINDVLQDHDGFMWFATANGLCRYDGHSFKIYNTQNAPFSTNNITRLTVDSKNHLFIQSTQNAGSNYSKNTFQVLDLKTYEFIKLNEALPNMPFTSDQVKLMCHDELGNIFFFTDKPYKLWQYSNASSFELRAEFPNLSIGNISISPLIASMNAVNDCVVIYINESCSYLIRRGWAPVAFKFTQNAIGILDGKQFFLYDASLKKNMTIDSLGNTSKLPNTSIVSSTSWTIPNYKGPSQLFKSEDYNYYLLKENQWVEIFNAIEQKNLGYFGIPSYCEDRNGNYWFCTDKGIYQVNIRKNQFKHLFCNAKINKIGNDPVRAIYADQNQKGQKRIFAMVSFQLRVKEEQESVIQNMGGPILLKKNEWLYTASGPTVLTKLNLTDGKTRSYPFLPIGETWSIADFSDSLLLIGGSSGIQIFNTISGVSRLINYNQKNINPPVNVYRIIKTKSKGWVAVAENGIYLINENATVYDYYGKSQQNPEHRLPITDIFDFYEDKSGVAWLAMNGEGLIRWNWNSPHPMLAENFKKFTIENGLLDNILYRIEEDNNNNFWISSYSGLMKFNKQNFSTKIYRTKDGLANTEFNRISSFKDDEGIMYFGGQNGIDVFDPRKMNADSKESIVPFRLVGLSKYASKKDTIVDVSKDLETYQEIIMNVGDKLLTVNYSLLDYQNRTHLYAYRIEGLDKDWIYMNEEVIRLSNLPYGKFKLRIKAQLESGSWNEEEIVIPINVIKPFYLETWFYSSLFFLVVFIFLLIYKLRVNKLEKDKLRLESLVQKRTNSLYEALEDRELLLKEIHHRVKNNLQVISGLLQLQKDELQNEEAQAAINEGQSRVGSIALIHQNLYQNKDLGNIEFKTFIIDLTKQVADLYQNENRKIELNLNLDELFIDIDTAVPLGLIVNELLTNTYKYAFVDTYQIKVDIKLIQTEKGKYQLTYKDNGPGLKENPDFDNAKTLGINLIGGLAKQLSGTAVYEFDGGSKFIISLKDSKLRKQES